jgi:hypothetical protein
MPSWLSKLRLGRILYWGWHRPRGLLVTSIRAGGPLEQRRTARGQQAMRRAAGSALPPLLPPPPDTPAVPVHVLTGQKLWYQTAFMLHSLARFQPVHIVVHDDGTLKGECLANLRRVLPSARFVPADETAALLETLLPAKRFPTLRRRREELVLFRKLIDVHLGATGWRLFLDSDMLFFRQPTLLSQWLAKPDRAIHMTDVVRAYGYELDLLAELAGRPVPDLVNTGILGLRSEAVDWERLERQCRVLVERAGTHYYQEQALAALHLADHPHSALPRSDYLVLPVPPEALECRAVVHHYVAGSKSWYFRHNWRRFQANGATGKS